MKRKCVRASERSEALSFVRRSKEDRFGSGIVLAWGEMIYLQLVSSRFGRYAKGIDWKTWSSHDSNRYYALMCGMNHKTVSNALLELASAEKNIIWLADEENKTLMRKSKRGIRRHILLVGLNKLLREELSS